MTLYIYIQIYIHFIYREIFIHIHIQSLNFIQVCNSLMYVGIIQGTKFLNKLLILWKNWHLSFSLPTKIPPTSLRENN